jgi:hypothetical protein
MTDNYSSLEEATKSIIRHHGFLEGVRFASEQIAEQFGDSRILSSDLYRKAVLELGDGDPLGTEDSDDGWKPFDDDTYPLENPNVVY